jgi:hypothetical protein
MTRKPLPIGEAQEMHVPSLRCNDKERGDAAEYLTAGMMILAGIPTTRMPDNWKKYDLIAQQRPEGNPQRISVKARSNPVLVMEKPGGWDWIAVVELPKGSARPRFWLIPQEEAMPEPRLWGKWRITPARLDGEFHRFEDNFALLPEGLPTIKKSRVNRSIRRSAANLWRMPAPRTWPT